MQETIEISRNDLLVRLWRCLEKMENIELAQLYNKEFGEGLTYISDDTFEQVVY